MDNFIEKLVGICVIIMMLVGMPLLIILFISMFQVIFGMTPLIPFESGCCCE